MFECIGLKMEQTLDRGFSPPRTLRDGLPNKTVRTDQMPGAQEGARESDLVRIIQLLVGLANNKGLPDYSALLRGAAERISLTPPVKQPLSKQTEVYRN